MTTFEENPKIISQTDKPIEQDNNKIQKVDINVLRDGQVAGAQRLEQAALAAAVGANEAVPPAGRERGGGNLLSSRRAAACQTHTAHLLQAAVSTPVHSSSCHYAVGHAAATQAHAPPVVELQLRVGQQLVAVVQQGEGLEVDVARLRVAGQHARGGAVVERKLLERIGQPVGGAVLRL